MNDNSWRTGVGNLEFDFFVGSLISLLLRKISIGVGGGVGG